MTSPEEKGAAVDHLTDRADRLNAFVSLTGERGPGPALAVKDNIDVKGMVTTAGTMPPPDQPPAIDDAWSVKQMRKAGYHVVGKTNMHEHGLGSTNHNPHYGDARNPHDPDRISGGSSGGSAAALIVGACDLALGSDTGGSIRIPSALCGTVGVRPTFGAVSVDGLSPLAHTLDVIGPIATDVAAASEALRILEVIDEVPTEPAADFRVGVPHNWVTELDGAVARAWARVAGDLEPVDVGALDAFVQPGLTTLYTEAATHHGRQFRERPESLGHDVSVLLEQGLKIPATDYIEAQIRRTELRARIDAALEDLDALVVPTTRCTAPLVEEDPLLLRDKLTPFTRPFSVTGHPVLAMPIKSDSLPVGVQIVGRRGGEADLMKIGLALESAWGN